MRERFRDAARAAILDVAEQVLVRDGLATARIDVIASESGVSVGTIYNLFGDRAGLVGAILELRGHELHELLDVTLNDRALTSFDDKLGALVRALFAYFRERWAFFRMLTQAEHAPEGKAHGTRMSRDTTQRVVLQFTSLIEQGQAEGRVRAIDPEYAAVALLGLLKAAVEVEATLDRGVLGEARADQVLDLFLHGAGQNVVSKRGRNA